MGTYEDAPGAVEVTAQEELPVATYPNGGAAVPGLDYDGPVEGNTAGAAGRPVDVDDDDDGDD